MTTRRLVRPCLSAFMEDAALPAAVRGPVHFDITVVVSSAMTISEEARSPLYFHCNTEAQAGECKVVENKRLILREWAPARMPPGASDALLSRGALR